MVINDCSNDGLDAIQAWAAVVAILAGFAYVSFQRWRDTEAAGRAAGHLARHSVDFVTQRLEALIDTSKPVEFALRGGRATEMIEVFRELDVARLPPERVEAVAVIRSAVYAINSRIDEVLRDEGSRRSERRRRLHSAGRTLTTARAELEALRKTYAWWNQEKFKAIPVSSPMAVFLTEASAAKNGSA